MNGRAGLHIPCIIMCALIFIECLLNSIKCSALGIDRELMDPTFEETKSNGWIIQSG